MGAFARETRLSETTFVQTTTADGADYRNRIWTIGGEIPFAGHPSLGTAVAVAAARDDSETTYVQETQAGLQPIAVRRDGDGWRASMLQEPATFGREAEPPHVMAAVGLLPADAHREVTPQTVSTGLPTLVALVATEAAIATAVPDFPLVDAVLEGCGAQNFYIAWHDGDANARARMFTRMVEGGEDPATGSAAGPLCAYLHRYGRADRVEISQGVEMRRPSVLTAEVEGDRVRVSGGVVTVIDGTVRL
jgi:trans-2,3-dihydro-3-hydroxyanthranilate isomerase